MGDRVKVTHAYQYEGSDGETIRMTPGDEYVLKKCVTSDWWYVRTLDKSEQFYVPSAYVELVGDKKDTVVVVATTPNDTPTTTTIAISTTAVSSASQKLQWVKNDVSARPRIPSASSGGGQKTAPRDIAPVAARIRSDESTIDAPSPGRAVSPSVPRGGRSASSDRHGNGVSVDDLGPRESDLSRTPDSGLCSADYGITCDNSVDKPLYVNLSDYYPGDRANTPPPCTPALQYERPLYINLGLPGMTQQLQSPTGTSNGSLNSLPSTPDSALTPDLPTPTGPPSNPAPPPMELPPDWDTYTDRTGRKYYHNSVTKESSWKPPRVTPCPPAPQRPTSPPSPPPPPLYVNFPFCHASLPSSVPHLLKDDPTEDTPVIMRSRTFESDNPSMTQIRHQSHLKVIERHIKTQSVMLESFQKKPSPLEMKLTVEMEGHLNRTKILEAGKKVRKNWSSSYAMLIGSSMVFYRDQKAAKDHSFGRPDFSFDLKGTQINWAMEKSSKKNVFELSTVTGLKILLQSDDPFQIGDWFLTIDRIIKKLALEPFYWPLPVEGEESDDDVLSATGNSNVITTTATTTTTTTNSTSNTKQQRKQRSSSTDSGRSTIKYNKVKKKLLKLLNKRPPIENLRKRGLLQELVFGSHISKLCDREGTTVPSFVTLCILEVDNRGLLCDGIYRVSGNLSQVQRVRCQVDQEPCVDLEQWKDINVIAGALKLFFRELPEPLFTLELFDEFVGCLKHPTRKKKVSYCKAALEKLPTVNYETSKQLFKHLARVMAHCEENRMESQSLAIIFGPNLLWPEIDHMGVAVSMVHQSQVVELILLELDNVFLSSS